jgi:phosphoglycolate phosphatase
MKTNFDLIVFDWDGTLMDSTGHIVSCMQQAIIELNLPQLSNEEVGHIIGLGLQEAVTTLYPQQDSRTRYKLAEKYREVWLSSPDETPLFAHAKALIEKLSDSEHFLGVATGKSRKGLNRVLDSTGLGDYFHATRSADECHSKPHPQMIEELMDYTGVMPDKTLMIGDTEFDMLMAKTAGAKALAISHGAHSRKKLIACEPDAIVDNLYQVEQWLTSC